MKCELNHIRLELSFPQMTLPSKSIWYWIQKGCHHWIFLDKEGFYAQIFQDCSLESGCGSASCWNKTAIAFFVPCFPQIQFRHGQKTFLSCPGCSLLYNMKSENMSCRIYLWDKQTFCIHLFVLPFFIRFCSAKFGISFRSIVLVVSASR